jgi:hypothetical protein
MTPQERNGYEQRQASIDPLHYDRISHDANPQQVPSRFGRMKKDEGFIPGTVKLRPPMKKGLFGRPKKEKGAERMTFAALNENPLDMFPENPMQVNPRSASTLPPPPTSMAPTSTRTVQRHSSMANPSIRNPPPPPPLGTVSLDPTVTDQRTNSFNQPRRRNSSNATSQHPSTFPLKNDTIEAVLEIFPDACRDRVVQLEQDGTSTRTILCILADESNNDEPQASPVSLATDHNASGSRSEIPTRPLPSHVATHLDNAVTTMERLELGQPNETSFRKQTIREFFPFSKSSRTNELLRENSLATVMDILAEESMDNTVPTDTPGVNR